jgi:hypothetical protein
MPARKTRTHCKDCGDELTVFNTVWVRSTSRNSRCGTCLREYTKQWTLKRLQQDPNYGINRHRKTCYGLTPEQYKEIFEFQQEVCAICREKSEKELCVDHDHITNNVRGLLCYKCNSILGLLNDDEDTLLKVIDYLKRTTWVEKAS